MSATRSTGWTGSSFPNTRSSTRCCNTRPGRGSSRSTAATFSTRPMSRGAATTSPTIQPSSPAAGMAMLAPLLRVPTISGERKAALAVGARAVCVKIHRYFGLAIAVFLTVAGLTGSILAFDTDLDAWLNPELFEAKASGPILPPSEIAKSVEKLDPRVIAAWIPLVVEPGESALVWISTEHDPATGDHYQVGFNQVFVEPSTGEILGKREWGAFSVAKQDL